MNARVTSELTTGAMTPTVVDGVQIAHSDPVAVPTCSERDCTRSPYRGRPDGRCKKHADLFDYRTRYRWSRR